MKKTLIILILFMLSAPFIDALELKKVLEIGSNEREDYIFFQTGPIVVDKYGNIYAVEGETQVIRKYDKTGKFVKKTGSKGQGPLEFMAITSMAFQDERFLVYDFGNKRLSLYDLDLNLVRQGSLSGIRIHMAASKDYYIADTIGGSIYYIVFRKPFAEGVQGKAHESKPSIPEKFLSSARAMAFFRHLFAVHPVSQQVVATYWTPLRGELQLTFFDGVGNLLRRIESEAIVSRYRIDENRLDRATAAKASGKIFWIYGIDWADNKSLIVQYVYGRSEQERKNEMVKIDALSGRILGRKDLDGQFIMKCVRGGYVYGHILDGEDAEIKIGVYAIE
jgi:hypothetical protein